MGFGNLDLIKLVQDGTVGNMVITIRGGGGILGGEFYDKVINYKRLRRASAQGTWLAFV